MIENIARRDRFLNEVIVYLNGHLIAAENNIVEAWKSLSAQELEFVNGEIARCLTDVRYFLENYYCIRTENAFVKTFYPLWDHQEYLFEIILEEQAKGGQCLIIVLKPRQTGISTMVSGMMFHRTAFQPHTFTMSMAHDKEASTNIYKMMMRAYNYLPWWMQPAIAYNREGEYVEFQNPDDKDARLNPGLGSAIQVANAQRVTGVAIGRTIRSLHACLTEKNLVVDEIGYLKPLSNVRSGDRILVENGKVGTVLAVTNRLAASVYDGAEYGYKITPWCNAAFPIEGTGNHKILCVESYSSARNRFKNHHKNENPTWGNQRKVRNREMLQLRDITLKHCVIIPVTPISMDGQMPGGERVEHRKHGGGRVNSWDPPIATREFGFACGLYLAEGNGSHRNICLSLDVDEEALAERFEKAIGVKRRAGKPRADRTRQHFFDRSSLRDWFAKHFGHKDAKRIPRWAWTLGREFLAGIVEGLIVGDGHNKKTESVTTFTSTRSHLALALREAVCSLGHGYGGITSRPAGVYYGRNCQQVWIVSFGRVADESMRSEYAWKSSTWSGKRNTAHARYSPDKSEIIVAIRKVERVHIGRVWDIEVDTKEHTFMLPGALTHNSEVAKWPENSGIFTSDIEPSMNAKDEFAVMESTAFGRNGLFYNHWRGSVAGDTGWLPVFIPVYRARKYSLPIKGEFTLTEEERKFTAKVKKEEKFDIKPEFWNWRRKRIRSAVASTGAPWEHYEAYPITPDEAFQSSGVCAFDRTSLMHQRMTNVCKPIWVGEIKLTDDAAKTFDLTGLREVEDDEILMNRKNTESLITTDRLWIWEWPEEGERYYVSSDSGLGVIDGDFSVCQVFRAGVGRDPDVQVAEWWGHTTPQQFARINIALGMWYQTEHEASEIATEYQGPGITTGDELIDLDYLNLYRPRHKDRLNQQTPWFHWITTIKTRDPIITTMNEALISHTIIIRSETLIDEMYDFGSLGGRFEGQGNHDDGVMASMINLYCLRETLGRTIPSTGKPVAKQEESDPNDLKQYMVYDEFLRMRGQHQSKKTAEDIAAKNPGWTVRPVMICKANTAFSPIYDAGGVEHDLRFRHGMDSMEIVPEVVNAYRTVMDRNRPEFDPEDW